MAAVNNPITLMSMQELLDETCGICHESLYFQKIQPIETPCHHRFHRHCLSSWCERTDLTTCRCPACRAQFNFKTQLTKIGTQIRDKVRTSPKSEIDDLDFTSYESEDVKAIKAKLTFMRRDGTRRKAGHGTRRSPNRSLSASSLTPSPTALSASLSPNTQRRRAIRFRNDYPESTKIIDARNRLLERMLINPSYKRLKMTESQKLKFRREVFSRHGTIFQPNTQDVFDIEKNAGSWFRHTIDDLSTGKIKTMKDIDEIDGAFSTMQNALFYR